jgi:hypothetical protein
MVDLVAVTNNDKRVYCNMCDKNHDVVTVMDVKIVSCPKMVGLKPYTIDIQSFLQALNKHNI